MRRAQAAIVSPQIIAMCPSWPLELSTTDRGYTSQGRLLVAILYHFQMMNPLWPDAQPYDNLLFVVAAILIVFLNRHQMFQRGSGVTDVVMTETAALKTRANNE
jgi:hypothetical protein